MAIKNLSLFEPIYAVFSIVIFICCVSVLFVYWLRPLNKLDNKSDFKLIIVFAEFLGSIGLIGLITFAGRLELNADKFISERIYSRSMIAVNKNIKDVLALPMCISAVASLDVEEISFNGLCTYLKKYDPKREPQIYLGYVKAASHSLTNQLITSGDIVNGLKFSALAGSVSDFSEAQNEKSKNEATLFSLNKQDSSLFILVCAVLVGMGVSLKIARAYLEWESEKKKYQIFKLKSPANTQPQASAAHE